MFEVALSVVTAKLGRDVRAECESEVKQWGYRYNGGSEWASWCCFLSFVRDVVGWSCPEHARYALYEAAALYGGPRLMCKEFVLLSERAAERHVGDGSVLHNDRGPSIRWHCGTRLWHINGVRVDEQIVLRPETQTLGQIEAEQNADVKAIRIERYGWPRYIAETGARLLDERDNPIEGTREALFACDDGSNRLVVSCPTKRTFALGVPPEMKTCRQAKNWLAGDEEDDVRVIART